MLNKILKKLHGKITNSFRLFLISIVCLTSFAWNISANASLFGWNFSADTHAKSNQLSQNSEYETRSNLPFIDDITADQNISKLQLTASQKHQALVWELTQDQEKRYLLLQQNRTGNYYAKSKLTPVEILGINARTNTEREALAQLDAKQEFEKNAKLLAFNTAYQQAALKLKNNLHLPIIKPFDIHQYSPYAYQPMNLQPHDKVMMFVKLNDSVRPITAYFMSTIEQDSLIQLNIYFLDKTISKEKINHWARSQNIPPAMVNKHQITLNINRGQFESAKVNRHQTPLLILIRAGESRLIDTGRF